MGAPSAYDCETAVEFLAKYLEFLGRPDPPRRPRPVSHLGFARRCVGDDGPMQRSTLSNVARGVRRLTPASTERIAVGFERSGVPLDQVRFFCDLAAYEQIPDTERFRIEKARRAELLTWVREASRNTPEAVRKLEFHRRWLHLVIAELCRCEEPIVDAFQLRQRLGAERVSTGEVRRALESLVRWGIVRRRGGRYEASFEVIASDMIVPTEVHGGALYELHSSLLNYAERALWSTTAPERLFTSVTLSMANHLVPEVQRRIHEFAMEIIALCEAAEHRPADEVYQLGVQVYPMTRPQSSDVTVGEPE